jgi:hypothetical protein
MSDLTNIQARLRAVEDQLEIQGSRRGSAASRCARRVPRACAYIQFLEDSYGTAGSFKTEGVTRFHSDPSGKEVEV